MSIAVAITIGFVYTWICVLATVWITQSNKSKREKHRLDQVVNFSSYYAVLEYHMGRAYEIIYKDRILIYSLESTKLDTKDFLAASKAFGSLVLRMLGPNFRKEFVDLYGDEETFFFILTEYFNQKYEDDEIRKGSMDELMEKEVEAD